MKPSTTVLLLVCVVFAGCSQLASPVNEPTTPALEPADAAPSSPATATSANETRPATTDTRTRTTMAIPTLTATQTATATPTATPTRTATATATQATTATRTPERPPTATATATTTQTAPSTPEPANLTLGAVDAENEFVELHNAGGRPLDLRGYVVDFDDGQRYTFPRYVLDPGATVTLHTGRGDSAGSELYAGFLYPVINDNRETILVENPNGRIVLVQRVPVRTTTG